ncbi:FG-GAP-like repeat-containing protein [Micromonospora sp. WMMD1102]|uniref:FG-GAP-like repeat-containing protein n=1 Tax=Micromonospora sp. WMMD1102 TaxID=3016105 RepID=UPI00241515A6|nr:FG-GAP-like repeat-containing protein [Micromonospora sp. WMMD1102]MDG4789586.1 FG-GAP-like repeat-containing protein [Micromonospora sp. WMMD1102]
MWRRRTAMTLVIVIVVAVGGIAGPTPGPVWAAGRGEQIFGDVNGDGFTDRATLGLVQPDLCSVIVEYGTASRDYRLPVAFVYLRPGGSGIGTRCPELGVAVDLTGDRREELVVAWFPGPPPTVPYHLMALDGEFQPFYGLVSAIFAPYYVGTADFDGDGREDVYSVTDQGQGIETYLNRGDGTLVHGPEQWCARPLGYDLRDFDLDGATDLVNSYIERCRSTTVVSGVAVVLDDGRAQDLQHDPVGLETWDARVVNANGDNIPDIRTVSRSTGVTEYFIGTPGGQFVLSPKANTDSVQLTGTKAVTIDVRANDQASTQATVTITAAPRYGTVQVISGGRIVYRPRANHGVTDRFTYQLTEGARRSSAVVYLRWTG